MITVPITRTSLVIAVVAAGILLWLAGLLSHSLGIIVAALVLGYILHAGTKLLQHIKIPRILAIAILYFLVLALIAAVVALLIPPVVNQVNAFLTNIPQVASTIREGLEQLTSRFFSSQDASNNVAAIVDQVESAITNTLTASIELSASAALLVLDLILVLVISLYGVYYARPIHDFVIDLVPKRYRADTIGAGKTVVNAMKRYIVGQIIVSLVLGIGTAIALAIVGVPYAVLLGLFTGLAAWVPTIGPIVSGVVATAVALSQSVTLAVITAVVFFGIQQLEEVLVTPNVFGHKLGVNPIVVIVAIIIGAELGGIPGMFLATPVVAILAALRRYAKQNLRFTVDQKLASK